jgi:integrase/recombinase XerD
MGGRLRDRPRPPPARAFTDRLARQKKASPNTVAAYRDTCRLLLTFTCEQTGKALSTLSLADLDATPIGAFLQHPGG